MGLQYKLSKILIKLNCKVIDMSGLLKKIMLSASGFALLCGGGTAEARESTSLLKYSKEVRAGSTEYDQYVRQGQEIQFKYTNPNSPVIDPETKLAKRNPDGSIVFEDAEAVLTLKCTGGDVSPYTGFDGTNKWGGWQVKSETGVCYGVNFNAADRYHLEAEATSKCDESTDISPDEKDYCTHDGNNVHGNTGDDMFAIKVAESNEALKNASFIEYRKVGDMNSEYRLRWVRRTGNADYAGREMMIPSGPPGDYGDYKTYMGRYLNASSSAPVVVEKGCFPIEVELCINEAPIAINDGYELDEETSSTFNVLANDYDNDHTAEEPDPIEVVGIVSDPKNGSVSWARSGKMTYVPEDNFFGKDTFTYQITDSKGAFAVATVTMTVHDLPEIKAKNINVTLNEETSATRRLLSYVDNPNNYRVTFENIPSKVSHGSLNVNSAGNATYTPKNNFAGKDRFTYRVYDQRSTYSTGTVNLTVKDLPEIKAKNDYVRINEDTTASFSLFSNDYNPNGYTLSLASSGSTGNGKVSVSSSGQVNYIPNANFYGTDRFTYKVYDQKGTYSTATATINVNSMGEINTRNDSVSACSSNGGSVGFNALGNDAGTGLSVISSSGVSVSSNGSFSLSPGNYSGSYTAKDYSHYRSTDSARIKAHVSGPWTRSSTGSCSRRCSQDVGTRSVSYKCNYASGCGSCSKPSSTESCVVQRCYDPLVIDLDGDGIELTNRSETNAKFDLDLDGVAEELGGWIGADDAFLVLDSNNDGIINDKSELFGDSDGFSDGFDKLDSYDSNSDGVIDMGDDVFASLQLWQDKDGDGLTDAGELMSIFDVGLTSISLGVEEVDNIINDQWESHRSTVSFDDGTEGQISEIWFQKK